MFKYRDIDTLEKIAKTATVHTVSANRWLNRVGDNDDYTLFLLRGTVELTSQEGQARKLSAGSSSARNPISRLKPYLYDVLAQTDVVYMKIPDDSLYFEESVTLEDDSDISTLDDNTSILNNELTYDIYNALAENRLKLPSLPDIAVQVIKAVEQHSCDAHSLAKIIRNEPVIIAKLLHTVNSPLYGGSVRIKTSANAIARLGLNASKKLIVSFCLQDLYRTDVSLLKSEMKKLREQSIKLAAISTIFADKLRLHDPEEALLGGLLHNIGGVAILDHIRQHKNQVNTKRDIIDAIRLLQAEISAMILRKWDMDEELIKAALHANDWHYEHEGSGNLADIVIIANMHSLIGTKQMLDKPTINELPAFKKLGLYDLSPRSSLSILDEAKHEIEEIATTLSL